MGAQPLHSVNRCWCVGGALLLGHVLLMIATHAEGKGDVIGWNDTDVHGVASEFCNIRRLTQAEIASMTPAEWQATIQGAQPVIFPHHSHSPMSSGGMGYLDKDTLLSSFATVPVHVCAPVGRPLSGCALTTLGEWVQSLQARGRVASARADEER